MAEITLAVFHGPHQPLTIENKNIEDVSVSVDEILARIIYASICGSDLHTIDGRRTEPTPSVLGHEGVVEAIISKRTGVSTGDRLTFSVADCCSECSLCLRGLSQKCSKLFKYGHAKVTNGSGLNGCYASHILIRKGTFVVTLPGDVDCKLFTPVNCALATMVNALESMEMLTTASGPKDILVQGAGLLGVYTCAMLSHWGYKVYCMDAIKPRLNLVSQFGAVAIHANEVSELLADGSIDVVIEACGIKSTIPQALRVLRPGGAYILVGLIHADSALNLTAETIMRKCLTIRGIHNYSSRHLEKAVKFLTETADKYPYDQLFDPKVYALTDITNAVQAAKTRSHQRVLLQSQV